MNLEGILKQFSKYKQRVPMTFFPESAGDDVIKSDFKMRQELLKPDILYKNSNLLSCKCNSIVVFTLK